MEGKIIKKGYSAFNKVAEGAQEAANAIKTTLGPSGKCVAIVGPYGSEITRDGATVAKSISFSDQGKNIGAELVRKAASQTEDQAGDGTSTTSVLISEMIRIGQFYSKSGRNTNEIKSGMLKTAGKIVSYINSVSTPVNGDLDKIRQIATISANNDPEIGQLVVEGMKLIGIDGVLTADLSSGLDNFIDVTTGMKIERGWASPSYVNVPEAGTCVFENPYIFVVTEKIQTIQSLGSILEAASSSGRPLLIVCDEIDEQSSMMIILNVLRGFKCCVVKGIDFGDGRKNIMQDLSVMVGANMVGEAGITLKNCTIEDCGTANKVVISRDNMIVYEGGGNPDEVKARAEILKKRLEDPTSSDYDKTKFRKRIASLVGGVGIIRAGGATETEKQNRKATIEDSILASKSAISEGCVPGGGWAYLYAVNKIKSDKNFIKNQLKGDEVLGFEIIVESLPVIMKTVAENAGFPGDVVINKVTESLNKKKSWGFDAKNKVYCSLEDAGILDSVKVLRVSLENAVSTAAMIILTDCIVIPEPVVENDNKGDNIPNIPGL